jgi:biofilm PGA synthesis lipoprotein PgaB
MLNLKFNGVFKFNLGFFLFFLLFSFFLVSTARAFDGSNQRPYYTDRGQYNYAKLLFDDGEFMASAKEFGRLIESFPASTYTANAQFMIASAYLKAGRLKDAGEEFARFISNFPESPLAGEAENKLKAAEEEDHWVELIKAIPKRVQREPIRAVQVFYFDGKTIAEMEAELKALSRGGVDTIMVRAFHNPGDRFHPVVSLEKRESFTSGLYFRSSHAPVIEDFLGDIIPLAHKYGLKVFAWMTTRYADYGVEDNDDLKCVAFNPDSDEFVTCKGLDLFNEAVVKRLENIYLDLAEYDIDGILFQDDMVLRHTEGFGPHAAALYEKDFGRQLIPKLFYFKRAGHPALDYTGLFWEWAAWKNRRLLHVAKRLRTVVREKNPDVKFAINLMYESVTNPGFGLAWLSQSIKEAKKLGFDYYSIMAYHRQMADELHMDQQQIKELIEALVREAVLMVGDAQKVMIKFQTRDWDTRERIADSEVVEFLRSVRSVDGVSMALVPYQSNFPYYELGGLTGIASIDGEVR